MRLGNWLRQVLGVPASEPLPIPSFSSRTLPLVHPTDLSWVGAAVEAMLRYPEADQNQMLAFLRQSGFSPPEAWRVNQFVPIAFSHVVFRGQGIQFQPGYILMDPESGARSSHLLADEPLYVAGVVAAETRLLAGSTPQQLLPVFGRSAEWSAIQQLMGPDGRLDGVILTEPLLMTC